MINTNLTIRPDIEISEATEIALVDQRYQKRKEKNHDDRCLVLVLRGVFEKQHQLLPKHKKTLFSKFGSWLLIKHKMKRNQKLESLFNEFRKSEIYTADIKLFEISTPFQQTLASMLNNT